jgi:hypothetical protein
MCAHETLVRLTKIARLENDEHLRAILRALELLGKHHKLFTEKLAVETGDLAERITEAWGRLEAEEALERADGRANDNVRPGRVRARRAHVRKAAPKGPTGSGRMTPVRK